MKRAIEDSFPIVEINRLAIPERNAFKPIYQMHKWFARRASCVFRAILLGALKPLPLGKDGKPLKSGAQVIMEEFYKDHTNDPDTNGKVVLDPFMGGGTTIVESLRLGCNAIGIDLNPVAWFIVKTEIEPVDIEELKAAFKRLEQTKVEWSGKPLKETLLDLYKTKCPACGGEADIIYTFWVKSAICTSLDCQKQIPLYGDYIVSQKSPSIRYVPDCECPECKKSFDWELEPATMIGNPKLMVNSSKFSAGQGRGSVRWAYGHARKVPGGITGEANCPWCEKEIQPNTHNAKPKKKKVELSVLLCPKCEEVWQHRGSLDDQAICPSCKHNYNPKEGNIPDKGKSICSCGNVAKIIDSIRTLPEEQPLPIRPYGIEAFCAKCASSGKAKIKKEEANLGLFEEAQEEDIEIEEIDSEISDESDNPSIISKNKGKFFKRIDTADLALYQKACDSWEKNKSKLPYPKSEIPIGQETKRLHEHHYHHWNEMFNPRQLVGLATLLKCVSQEDSQRDREQLLLCCSATTDTNNLFTRFMAKRDSSGGQTAQGVFARHDFQPKTTICEQNIWGLDAGGIGSFLRRYWQTLQGIEFGYNTFDVVYSHNADKRIRNLKYQDRLFKGRNHKNNNTILCKSSKELGEVSDGSIDFVISDPPYSDNVNYSELGDFYYVWQRLILKISYPHFAAEITPKTDEVIKNQIQGKGDREFASDLTKVFCEANRILKPDGLFIFTFHHAEGSAWVSLLQSVCDAEFQIIAVYPVQSEGESSLHLMDKQAISYDLIHVCRKRGKTRNNNVKSWAGVRQTIRQKARDEIKIIEFGRYGNEPLSAMDRNIILIGKCLELYSEFYGKIVDYENKPVPLHTALEEIKMMVDQLTAEETAFPSELEEIDAPSYVYLTCLCDRREINSDEVHKATRGITEPSTLMESDLMVKGRAKRGRTYEVKLPLERLDVLKKKFGSGKIEEQQVSLFEDDLSVSKLTGNFIDSVHFLIALAESGESVVEWLEKFRGQRPAIRVALEYMSKKNKNFIEPVRKILNLIDERTLFTKPEES